MYESKQIENRFGAELVQYIENKNKGGLSNKKGNHYENYFAVYKIAEYAKAFFEENFETRISNQVKSLVDDLVIKFESGNLKLEHYQLKNSPNIYWGQVATRNTISYDFKFQKELNEDQYKEYESAIYLVISDENKHKSLKSSIPKEIQGFSDVIYFQYHENILDLIRNDSKVKEYLCYLSPFEKPEPDKIEVVAKALLGAWCECENHNISIKDFINSIQNKGQRLFIRSFEEIPDLDDNFIEILNKIPNFTWNIDRGFFHWNFFHGLQEGTLSYAVHTNEFSKFINIILRENPTNFEEIEGMLI